MARWHIQLGFPEGLKLWPAYEARSITAIQLLLAAGACIDAQDNLGNTALHTSAWFGSWDTEGPVHGTCALVKTLLAAGADSTIRNNDGLTAEDMAEGEAKAVLVATASGRCCVQWWPTRNPPHPPGGACEPIF